mmetsp:Transcript_120/g.427  ORF Transcript_120/g.427 Transcript_120/m.427 type:complete len:259 (-) Transcript_120:40-816(-)
MAKKGKKGKKGADFTEPPHDPSWERAVESGIWERTPDALPDANTWPTWGALRERILTSCKKINIMHSPALRDGFAAEIFKLSPPELATMSFRGCDNLTKFVLSPITSCPNLEDIQLEENSNLGYVLLQSNTLYSLAINKCPNLEKILIHCKNLSQLRITKCPKLKHIMILSHELKSLNLMDSPNISTVNLQCPALAESNIPPLAPKPKPANPSHPPISTMLRQKYLELNSEKSGREQEEQFHAISDNVIPRTFRPFGL